MVSMTTEANVPELVIGTRIANVLTNSRRLRCIPTVVMTFVIADP
jgi:hypothetical protein